MGLAVAAMLVALGQGVVPAPPAGLAQLLIDAPHRPAVERSTWPPARDGLRAAAMGRAAGALGLEGWITRVSETLDPPAPRQGWGTGSGHYMLATDADGRIVVEHGETHRRVYVSDSAAALRAADIARQAGVSEEQVTGAWLRDRAPHLGASPETALAPGLGEALWAALPPRGGTASHWLLLERGYRYDLDRVFRRGASGESELHPLLIGAWGAGSPPVLTQRQSLFQDESRNIVVRDLEFARGVRILGGGDRSLVHHNLLFSGVTFRRSESNFQSVAGLTFHDTLVADVWRTGRPEGETWHPHGSRESGFFIANGDGVLLDGVVLDRIGWAPDFLPDGSAAGGHPPSMYSHNLYLQWNTTDVTMRDSISMRAASAGAQLRGGAFLVDSLFLDNNFAFNTMGGDSGDRVPQGNRSLLLGNVITQAGGRGRGLPQIGATDWGVRNEALDSTLIGNIVAHANDPDNPDDRTAGHSALHHRHPDRVTHDDTIIWRWGGTTANADALEPEVLDRTTLQRHAAEVTARPGAGVAEFAEHLRGLEPAARRAAVQDVLGFFRAGFGIDVARRDQPARLRFVPDARADGVRWDNRLNWDTGDLPGHVAGDSVDLDGHRVAFGGTVRLRDLELGDGGGLSLQHGRLDVTRALSAGTQGGVVALGRAGQLWTEGTAGPGLLEIDVAGGRFANTGRVRGPVALRASGGQTVLATPGAVFSAGAGSRIALAGSAARVGFDGADGGMALLGLAPGATLRFEADAEGLPAIAPFRSGAFGAAPDLRSGVDLGGGRLELDLEALRVVTGNFLLMQAQELVGRFGDLSVTGLRGRDAVVVVDYELDRVWLRLTAGNGTVRQEIRDAETAVSPGNEDLLQALRQGAAQGG